MSFRGSFFPALAILLTAFAFSVNVALAGGGSCKVAEGSTCQNVIKTAAHSGEGCQHAEGGHCQNIIKTEADGGKVAVCACGMEFTVTDDTPSIEFEGNTYFVCSEACAEKIKADPAAMIPVIEQKAAEMKKAQHISGNVMYVDEEGNRVAMCSCGAEMKVTSTSVTRNYKGEEVYFCCDQCAAAFDKDAEGTMQNIHGKVCDKRHRKGKEI